MAEIPWPVPADNDWMKKSLWQLTSAERQLAEPIEKPWLYETEKPMTEPPDINHRRRIIIDQDDIDELFEDENLHFTERCSQYQEQDVLIEYDLLDGYLEWNRKMLEHATLTGDGPREDFFKGLTEVVEEDFDIVCEELWKHEHGRYEREERREGRTDFRAEIDDCYCAECNNMRTTTRARHEELTVEAERSGATHFWNGVPDCPCNACRMAPRYRAEHKERKREALLSSDSARGALRWCGCVKCKLRQEAEDARHKELKDEAKQNGTAFFISGIHGCPCNSCFLYQRRRGEHKRRKRAALRSSSSVEEALQDCWCIKCRSIRFYAYGHRDPEDIYWHEAGPSPDESEAEDEDMEVDREAFDNPTQNPPQNDEPSSATNEDTPRVASLLHNTDDREHDPPSTTPRSVPKPSHRSFRTSHTTNDEQASERRAPSDTVTTSRSQPDDAAADTLISGVPHASELVAGEPIPVPLSVAVAAFAVVLVALGVWARGRRGL